MLPQWPVLALSAISKTEPKMGHSDVTYKYT